MLWMIVTTQLVQQNVVLIRTIFIGLAMKRLEFLLSEDLGLNINLKENYYSLGCELNQDGDTEGHLLYLTR